MITITVNETTLILIIVPIFLIIFLHCIILSINYKLRKIENEKAEMMVKLYIDDGLEELSKEQKLEIIDILISKRKLTYLCIEIVNMACKQFKYVDETISKLGNFNYTFLALAIMPEMKFIKPRLKIYSRAWFGKPHTRRGNVLRLKALKKLKNIIK
jgi:hypothetical protein